MNWERRLREMVLAGGALAATACGGSTEAPVDAASHELSNGDAAASGDDATYCNSGTPCCNADPDPCCPMLSCQGFDCLGGVGPDDPAYRSCEARYQCEDFMNGIYTQEPDGSLVCVPRGIVVDASVTSTNSGPADASSDACVPGVCIVSCIDGGSGGVQDCDVERCCVPDDAEPEAATNAATDASAE